ncbi:hypothetical protein JMJ35_007256 [Cladonia borealis]|uniref:Tautomerase cis-CaaD-like domain-containing protein n=1 Tax=Cladonia borealis TaxID=184061 RepID=A0AA39UZL0_9LECA|nr:hypothetical protein JMJ35_007256 [Cladonia borealis]
MPLYEISHITPLSPSQKDALAASITQIHSHLFTTPSLFVNVRFTDISRQDVYVGGRKNAQTSSSHTIIAGREVGFELPPAGGDKAWLVENAASFRRLADEGDEDFMELVREMEGREDLY